MNADLQHAQDMLSAMQQQRDHALNANVSLLAALAGKDRRIAELEQEVSRLSVANESVDVAAGSAP